MCGINGIILSGNNENSVRDNLLKMNNQIVHRGPDSYGIYTCLDADKVVGLAMRRLAIIDLASGNQPIYNVDKSLVIVFNGEIYNYIELRNKLIEKGVIFNTNTDTEVILKGYELYGQTFFAELNGMFAIALHDKRYSRLVIVRDRLGEKPLFLYQKDSCVIFASELKSILVSLKEMSFLKPKIDYKALSIYFSLSYIPAPYTIYDGIKKVMPGTILEIDLNTGSFTENEFWKIPRVSSDLIYPTFDIAKNALQNLLYESVEQRMLSDVPLGAFLSGGVDSSIIAAIMADLKPQEPIETFTIGFKNKKFDESSRAQLLATHINANHNVHFLEYKDLTNILNEVLLNYDEPFADSSSLPTYFVSVLARKKLKVTLTGDGGDEVFGGYNRYDMVGYSKLYRRFIPKYLHEQVLKPFTNSFELTEDDRGLLFKVRKFINGVSLTEREDMRNIMCLGFLPNELLSLFIDNSLSNWSDFFYNEYYFQATSLSPINKARYLDMKITLEGDMLAKVDRASMLASLECRTPMLDHRLIEFSFNIPDSYLIHNRDKKYILKESFKHLLPRDYLKSPKSGFGIPVGDWLRTYLKNELISYVDKKFIDEQNIFQYETVYNLIMNHLSRVSDNTFKVWTFYCFQKWYKRYILL